MPHLLPGDRRMPASDYLRSMTDRKALLQACKEKKTRAGVYQLRNLNNGKVLVGSTTTLDTIRNSLYVQLKAGSHMAADLQADWNAMGENAFTFEVLAEHEPAPDSPRDLRTELRELENMFLNEIRPYGDRGYNFYKKT